MLLSMFAAVAPLFAVAPPQTPMSDDQIMEALAAFDWMEGEVTVEGDIATIDLPEGWFYLQSMDAQFMVERVWGNPPDDTILGYVQPPGEAAWAVIVSYDDSGYYSDDDVDDIDYAELLDQMQDDVKAGNAARKSAGYPTMELRGWAETPHYDHAEKKLYWAKRIHFQGEELDTLNYDVRVLGRRGALVMQAVAEAPDLAAVAAGCKELLAVTEFTPGNTYQEYDASIDKVAAYGIGGLIAGKVLLKAGILAKFGKLIAIAALGLVAFVKKLFGKGKKQEEPRRRRAS